MILMTLAVPLAVLVMRVFLFLAFPISIIPLYINQLGLYIDPWDTN
jgi:hypothetical protein